jgi:hypothetical protein
MVLVCVYTEFIISDSLKMNVFILLENKYYNMYFSFYFFSLFSLISCVNFKCHTIIIVIYILNFYIIFGTDKILCNQNNLKNSALHNRRLSKYTFKNGN